MKQAVVALSRCLQRDEHLSERIPTRKRSWGWLGQWTGPGVRSRRKKQRIFFGLRVQHGHQCSAYCCPTEGYRRQMNPLLISCDMAILFGYGCPAKRENITRTFPTARGEDLCFPPCSPATCPLRNTLFRGRGRHTLHIIRSAPIVVLCRRFR